MHKALLKLQETGSALPSEKIQAATETFAQVTQQALDGLAFHFARDLKEAFEQRGQTVEDHPPTLVLDTLVLNMDIAARKAQWFYGKEALTHPIPLSIDAILRAYATQHKAIVERSIDVPAFLADLYKAWQELTDERTQRSGRRPAGGRINIVETYSKLVMDRQSPRFWNAPSRSTFKDYERPLFIRDLVLAQTAPTAVVDGKSYRLRLGVATKSQADNANRSIWLPNGPLDGEYYSDILFETN